MVARDGPVRGIDARCAERDGSIRGSAESEEVLRCAHRHLAIAAMQLAGMESCPAVQRARYTLAAARFRALTERPWGIGGRCWDAVPFVTSVDGGRIALAELFASACLRHRVDPPLRAVDPDLVQEAKDLLRGLRWDVPSLSDGAS